MQGPLFWKKLGTQHPISFIIRFAVIATIIIGSALLAFTVRADSSSLPLPWQSLDIGNVGSAGYASYAPSSISPIFSVTGSGSDIWNTADAFHYVYQPLIGDGQITARVGSITNTNPWAKAGLMIRETLNPTSANAMIAITAGAFANFQRRTDTGKISISTHGPAVRAPYWIKLARSGQIMAASISNDGTTWSVVGSDTVTMSAQVYIGMAVTSHNNNTLNTSTFENVNASSAPTGTIIAHSFSGAQILPGQTGSVTASCQNGEQMVSGGYSVSSFETDNIVENYPSSPTTWTVTDNNSGGPSWVQVTAVAYCLQAVYSLATTIVHASNVTSVACPVNAVVTGGGFQGGASFSIPTTHGWQTNGGTIYAVCATQNLFASPSATATFTTPPYAGSTKGGSAQCGAGQLATGGGFDILSGETAGIVTNEQVSSSSWGIVAYGQQFVSGTVQAWAVCVIPPLLGPASGPITCSITPVTTPTPLQITAVPCSPTPVPTTPVPPTITPNPCACTPTPSPRVA